MEVSQLIYDLLEVSLRCIETPNNVFGIPISKVLHYRKIKLPHISY